MRSFQSLILAFLGITLPQPIEQIPLKDAVLCESCNVLTPAKNGHCPACGAKTIINLTTLIGEVPRVGRVTVEEIGEIVDINNTIRRLRRRQSLQEIFDRMN